ncbi:MAG: hypothetical protein PVG49_07550 [Desulfobacteraceae bacterium]|jgi:hypothetical protein
MNSEKVFLTNLRSAILDMLNNHLMQIQGDTLREYYDTKEAVIEMLDQESETLKRKRDRIVAQINRFLDDAS